MAAPPRILIGGVPFGCDNIGDEAILESAVHIIRELRPDVRLTVSTGDEDTTAEWLGVATCPLFGFDVTFDREAFRNVVRQHDAYIWCGATGLSDYPMEALDLLEIAQQEGKRTILWGVGMNSRLNPVKFEVQPGKRMAVLRLLTGATFGLVDFIALTERQCRRCAYRKMATCLGTADLVVLRDSESEHEVRKAGVFCDLFVGADSAITIVPAPADEILLGEEIRSALSSARKKVGICISTSAPRFTDIDGLVSFLDRLIATLDCQIVFLPMDPVVDLALMRDLQSAMKNPEGVVTVEGLSNPSMVAGTMSQLDVVISSRLHMLILATITHVPIVGISPGSKMDNFMRLYGLTPAGTAESCNFDCLWDETVRMLDQKNAFAQVSKEVRTKLLARLDEAGKTLGQLLSDLM